MRALFLMEIIIVVRGFVVSKSGSLRCLVDRPVVAGRSQDCDIPLNDGATSRRHVEISPREDGFFWRDLGSSNGTFLNGVAKAEGWLRPGDELRVGGTILCIELESPLSRPEKSDLTMMGQTLFAPAQAKRQDGPLARERNLLETVHAVMNEIVTNDDPCRLLDRILLTALPAIQAQRGAILLQTEGTLGGCPQCGKVHGLRDGHLMPVAPDNLRISQTVVRRVFEDGESVLYQDTAQDDELSVSASIMALQLRSIVCVPLRAKHGILGILYIDSDRQDRSYGEEDLLLAASVGNSAGIAIENARMHKEMLEKQKTDQEIETAWVIQQGFLVKDWPDDDPRFQVFGEMRPAKTVGGDFFDYVRPSEHQVGVLIGDVSGKGVPAALTMAQLLARFRLLARDGGSPAEVVRELNLDLAARSERGMFCTLCYLLLDLASGAVCCANAGHSPILHLGPSRTEAFGDASGPPIGILPGAVWRDSQRQLATGDTLMMYTDGMLEARRAAPKNVGSPEEYGIERLQAAASLSRGAHPKELAGRVNDAVLEFCSPNAPHDDCTLIAIRYLG